MTNFMTNYLKVTFFFFFAKAWTFEMTSIKKKQGKVFADQIFYIYF